MPAPAAIAEVRRGFHPPKGRSNPVEGGGGGDQGRHSHTWLDRTCGDGERKKREGLKVILAGGDGG